MRIALERRSVPAAEPPLALGRVRHVGEAVVMVIADTIDQAKDAAEAINVEYAELPATVTAIAMDDDTPAVWEHRPNNECFYEQRGYPEETKVAFENADVVVERTFNYPDHHQHDRAQGVSRRLQLDGSRYALYRVSLSSQDPRTDGAGGVWRCRAGRAGDAGDVGGSFGLRGSVYPEQVLVMWASRRVGKPVKWTAERSKPICDYQGRDNYSVARLALDNDGNFLGMHVRTLAALGAFVTTGGNGPPINNLGTWRAPTGRLLSMSVSGVFTNNADLSLSRRRTAGQPISSKRWSRPQRRSLDASGRFAPPEHDPPDAMPFKTGLVFTYDCGEFEKNLTDGLK